MDILPDVGGASVFDSLKSKTETRQHQDLVKAMSQQQSDPRFLSDIVSIQSSSLKLYVATSANVIFVLNISSRSLEMEIPTHFKKIEGMKFVNKSQLFVAGHLEHRQHSALRLELDGPEVVSKEIYDLSKLTSMKSFCVDSAASKIYASGGKGMILATEVFSSGYQKVIQVPSESTIMSIDIAGPDQLLATCENTIFVYSLNSNTFIKSLTVPKGPVLLVVACNYRELLCVASCADFSICIFDRTQTVPKIIKNGHHCIVKSLATSNNIMISGDIDGNVMSWDLIMAVKPMPFSGHFDSINSICIDEEKKVFYTGGSDKNLKKWDMIDYSEFAEFPFDIENIQEFRLSENQDMVIFFHNCKEIYYYDCIKEDAFRIDVDQDTYLILISHDTKNFYAIYKRDDIDNYQSVICKYTCGDLQNIEEALTGGGTDIILSAHLTPDDSKLVCGTKKGYKIYYTSDFHFYQEFAVRGGILKMVCSNETVFYVEEPNRINKKVMSQEGIDDYQIENTDFLKLSCGETKLFTYLRETGTLKIFLTVDFTEIARLSIPTLIEIIPHPQHQHFIINNDNFITGYSFTTFTRIFCIEFTSRNRKIMINDKKMKMYVYHERIWHPYDMDLSMDQSSPRHIIGTNHLKSKFESYLHDLVQGKIKVRNPEMENFLIMPMHMNLLHFYAELNKPHFLAAALEDGAGFFDSYKGTPIDISVELKHQMCFQECQKYLKTEMETNPLIMMCLQEPLIRAFDSGFNNISGVFKNAISTTRSSNLPTYVTADTKLPIIIGTDSAFPSIADFGINASNSESEGILAVYSQTYFSFAFTPGSSESIKFLLLLADTDDESVFKTLLIKNLLEYKWKQVSYIIWMQLAVYLAYLIILALYTTDYYGNNAYVIVLFVLSAVLHLYETIQMLLEGTFRYFHSGWTWIDLIRFALQTTYCVLIWVDYSYPTYDLLGTIVFLAYLRGIGYFRVFDFTRYYINLLVIVCYDIIPFLLMFLYSTVAFGLIYQVMLDEPGNNYFYYLTVSFELNIGGFNTAGYDHYMYLYFFLNSMINPIIMLNLLISIMANTYSDVSNNEESANLIELNELVLESELMMFWNRSKNQRKYFCICDQDTDEEKISDPVLGKVVKVWESIKDINSKVDKFIESQAQDKKDINAKLDCIAQSIAELSSVQATKAR